jgi:hypothetical protein
VNLRMKRAFEWEGLDVRKKTKRERERRLYEKLCETVG